MSKKKSHILLFIQRYQAGGAERQASYLGKYLLENGYRVSVLAFGGTKNKAFDWFKELERYALGFTEKNIFKSKPSLFIVIKKLYDLRRLKKQIRSINPDIIVPFTYEPNILVGRYWRKLGLKAGIWNQRDEGRYFNKTRAELKALHACGIHISNSKEGLDFLQELGVLTVNLIHNGIEIPNTSKVEKADSIVRFVMLANLHVFKDHITLLKAWLILLEEISSPKIELLLAGAFGNAEAEIRKFIKDHNVGSTVRILGKVDDTVNLLATSDIAVFSSYKEGLPNAVLESMAVGLPLIATRIPGTEEALGESYPYLVEPKNEKQLAKMMKELLIEKNRRTEIGQKNFQRVQSSFAIQKMGESYISLFDKLLPFVV